MAKKRVAERKINNGSIFLALIFFLLIFAGLLVYFKPKFTGFATNVIGTSTSSYDFLNGVFENTKFDSEENAVVLDNSSTGSYTSQVFDAGQGVIFGTIIYSIDTPPNSGLNFFARSCDDVSCSGESFSAVTETLNFTGRYFQYKTDFQTSGNSPKIYEVNITYSNLPISYSVNIESPTATTYNSVSVLIKISSNAPNVWFVVDSGASESYTGELNRSFSEGQHTINVIVNDSVGNQNSSSVAFTISLPVQPSCGDGSCNGNEDCSSCSNDCGECEEETQTSENTTPETTQEEESSVQTPVTTQAIQTVCSPDWQCSEWSECTDKTQTRTCNDANKCGTNEGMPALAQECTPPETCSDGIKNQNEGGIDCGGSCEKKCSIFTIVGGAVRDLPETGKQFFKEKILNKILANKTRTFIIIGAVTTLIIGFFAFRFFSKRKVFFQFKILNKENKK